jgi:GNAT superfamily N-acetyltransferase
LARGSVQVRDAKPEDLGPILLMWGELREASTRPGPLAPPPSSEPNLRRLLEQVAGDDAYRAVVAELDGEVVGMACFICRPMGPFVEAPVVQIDYLHVRSEFHRRGVGRALVGAAASYAEDVGADHVSVNVFPQLRDANRFYAKIGFTPMVVRRVASVQTLRRGLGLEVADGRRRAGMLARRRSVRARASTPA